MGKFSDSDWRPEIVEVFVETVFCMRLGITPCVIKPAATYAEATDRFHSPAASAGA